METIQEVRQTIDRYLKQELDDDAEVVDALEELDGVEITVDLLQSTHIGKIITKLVRDKRSEQVVASAKRLELKWKSLVMSKTDNKRKREGSSSESPAQKRKVSHDKEKVSPKVQPKKQVLTEKAVKEDVKKEIHQEEPRGIPEPLLGFSGETNNPARNQVQMKLTQSLGVCNLQGGTESSRVAVAIENALFNEYKDPKNKDYQQKFRSLFSNLKDELNDGLRNALFTGDLTAEKLIQMSYEELANPKLQKARKDLKVFQQEARRGDRHTRDATCTMFTCGKCGQNKTTYFQLQTRSADEPMTTFITCCNCGAHWKMG